MDDPQIRDVHGVSKRTAIREILEGLLPDADGIALAEMSDTICAAFKEHLLARYRAAEVHPIAGVEEVFEWLRNRGISIALTTGLDRDMI